MGTAFSALKRTLPLGEILAESLDRLVSRIAATVVSCTYALYVDRLLDKPQGLVKELWA